MKNNNLLFLFIICVRLNAQLTLVGNEITGSQSFQFFGKAVAINQDGTIILCSSIGNTLRKGQVSAYILVKNKWTQLGNIMLGNFDNEVFGNSLDMSDSGFKIIIGNGINQRPYFSRVYLWNGTEWKEVDTLFDGNGFGIENKISGDGNTVAVGSFTDILTIGQIRLYDWSNPFKLSYKGNILRGSLQDDRLGLNMALNKAGNRLATTSYNSSKATIYEWANYNWMLLGNEISKENTDKDLGPTIAMSSNGNRLIIGSPGINQIPNLNGQIRIYDFINSTWKETGRIRGIEEGERFGNSLDISDDGTRIVIGALFAGNSQIRPGAIRIYDLQNGSWKLKASVSGVKHWGQFGVKLAISGDGKRIITSEPLKNSNGESAGSVLVYELAKTTPNSEILKNIPNIKLFPNPANKIVNIHSPEMFDLMQITDINGRIIQSKLGKDKNQYDIDLSGYQKGIYILKVKSKGETVSQRLVVQ